MSEDAVAVAQRKLVHHDEIERFAGAAVPPCNEAVNNARFGLLAALDLQRQAA